MERIDQPSGQHEDVAPSPSCNSLGTVRCARLKLQSMEEVEEVEGGNGEGFTDIWTQWEGNSLPPSDSDSMG